MQKSHLGYSEPEKASCVRCQRSEHGFEVLNQPLWWEGYLLISECDCFPFCRGEKRRKKGCLSCHWFGVECRLVTTELTQRSGFQVRMKAAKVNLEKAKWMKWIFPSKPSNGIITVLSSSSEWLFGSIAAEHVCRNAMKRVFWGFRNVEILHIRGLQERKMPTLSSGERLVYYIIN